MRCAAVAEEAKTRGINCVHLGSLGEVEWLKNHYRSIGFPALSENDLRYLDFSDSVLITDAYHLDPNHELFTSPDWKLRVVLADDSTPQYGADLIIHPGLEMKFTSWNSAKLLSGPAYIPFRKSIVKKDKHLTPGSKNRVVVFGGGTDPYDFAGQFSRVLTGFPEFSSAVVFTDTYLNMDDDRFEVKKFGAELDGEIALSDVVFTTASTSSLEVIAREIPAGICCVVENQEKNYKVLEGVGVAARVGRRNVSGDWDFDLESVHRLLVDFSFRKDLVEASKKLIDLDGSRRIVDEILWLSSQK
jgi:spore coat polysaccharide biosynthesis predicted glycosyltransferase SpsG